MNKKGTFLTIVDMTAKTLLSIATWILDRCRMNGAENLVHRSASAKSTHAEIGEFSASRDLHDDLRIRHECRSTGALFITDIAIGFIGLRRTQIQEHGETEMSNRQQNSCH